MNPLQVCKEALKVWRENLIPLAAINGVMMVLQAGLKMYMKAYAPSGVDTGTSDVEAATIIVFGICALVLVCVNSFLTLALINYARAPRQGHPYLFSALKDAMTRTVPFLKSLFLLWAFVLVGMSVAALFLAGGKIAYASLIKSSGSNIALSVLLASSTVFVVLTISVIWYSFFFSLGPLVAAYEHLPAVASLRASRDRVRGNALRYLIAIASIGILYFVVGLGLYAAITRFTHDKLILDMIDPLLLLVFGPLALVVWYVSYKKLTEMKAKPTPR